MIIGGSFDNWCGKKSSIVDRISETLNIDSINGGNINEIKDINLTKLSIWMPNVSNNEDKFYPKKSIGCCLICSKVLRQVDEDEHKFTQAVTRIFKMNANAVIAIEKEDIFKFTLIDALGNIWVSTKDVKELCISINKFYEWFLKQQRKRTRINSEVNKFMNLVRNNAENIMQSSGDRYFGNCSTRCSKTFPAIRNENTVLVSPRNINKKHIETNDMIAVINNEVIGNIKPSVDTPIQLEIYKHFDNINFMIHGHAFFDNAPYTENYYCCGDVREVSDIMKIFDKESSFIVVNLKNHGFIIATNNLIQMESYLKQNTPKMKPFENI